MIQAILHGIFLAFGLILPLGAQNIFVFNQGANHKSIKRALPVILTAAICDTLLITLAVTGVSLFLNTFPTLKLLIYIIGFIFLIYMAYTIWNEKPANDQGFNALSPKKQIGFALSVSLLNPHAIMDTIGVIGTSASTYEGTDKLAFTVTCIMVSWCWFFMLAIIGKAVGNIDNNGKITVYINKISALIILIVSVLILINIYKMI